MNTDSNKVYYGFTKHKDKDDIIFDRPFMTRSESRKLTSSRASIAMQKVGDKVYVGVVVCSEGDNFSRKLGRQKAEERMRTGNEGFTVPESLSNKFRDDH